MDYSELNSIVKTLPHDMRNDFSGPSLEKAVEHINNMDFSSMILKLSKPDPLSIRVWRLEELELAIQYYKNFLYLNKKYLNIVPIIVPSLEVDEIWHHHILDTRQYYFDCMNIFGYYFHHYPYFGMRSNEDQVNLVNCFEISQAIYAHEFGHFMESIWSQ